MVSDKIPHLPKPTGTGLGNEPGAQASRGSNPDSAGTIGWAYDFDAGP